MTPPPPPHPPTQALPPAIAQTNSPEESVQYFSSVTGTIGIKTKSEAKETEYPFKVLVNNRGTMLKPCPLK
eukprot:4795829-Amphidinium_carterae.2